MKKGAPKIFTQTPSKSSSLQTQQKTAVAGKVSTTMWPERCRGVELQELLTRRLPGPRQHPRPALVQPLAGRLRELPDVFSAIFAGERQNLKSQRVRWALVNT